ncbi:MAG: LCP family protein, partial [Dehalococcoidia bacterium]|nr:LCP family protein [Dehalococcoidia bacterium]
MGYSYRNGRRAPIAPKSRPGRSLLARVRRLLLIALVVAFFGGSVAYGGQALDELRLFVASVGATVAVSTGLPLPVGPTVADDGPVWGGRERVNILLLGLDCREDEAQSICRSDSLMVVSLDPQSNQVTLLSIPRDLWVPIPLGNNRFGEERINTVFGYAAANRVPGGGPALAKRTVQYNLGIRIHYAAWTNFEGFVKVVDTLGGIDIDVPRPLKDDQFPTDDYRTQRIYFHPGLQHMDGRAALMYARSRHQDSDINRGQRQQQVILAARTKALQLDLIPKLPRLLNDFQHAVQTDMATPQILALARIAKDVDLKNIKSATVPAFSATTSQGADILLMDRQGMAKIVRELFAETVTPEQTATIEVLNGATVPGLATRTAQYLTDQGMPVARFDTAPETIAQTVIYAPPTKRLAAQRIAQALNIPVERIRDRQPAANA